MSVIVPTYHRPDRLQAAVASVLAQQASGLSIEVIISLSDPGSRDDCAAAEALATADARVRVVAASMPGAAAARNAGLRAAVGSWFALLDDDCIAAPGWLCAGKEALDAADLVQGRTWPAAPVKGWQRTIRVEGLSWLWESCNIFVRRSAVEKGGLFDADWKRMGAAGHPWGEDTEWGWRLVRNGARFAFSPQALVHHSVDPGDYWGWLRERTTIRWFPLLVRSTPEVRRRFYRSYFFNQRHLVMTTAASLILVGAVARAAGARRGATAIFTAALLSYLAPAHRLRRRADVRPWVRDRLSEAVEFGCLASGTLRWRRVVL